MLDKSLAILREQAARMGVGENVLAYLALSMEAESRGNPNAKTNIAGNTAKGLFGFIDSTWQEVCQKHGLDARKRNDPTTQCAAAIALTNDHAKALRSFLGREATMGELYLAHFAGLGGARTVLGADETTSVRSLLGDEVVRQNAGIKLQSNKKPFAEWTAADLKYWASVEKMKMSGTAPDNTADRVLTSSGTDIITMLLQALGTLLNGLVQAIAGGKMTAADQNSIAPPDGARVPKKQIEPQRGATAP